MRLVLASSSPRRRLLLVAAGFSFDAVPADVEEAALPGEPPEVMVERLALQKARTAAGPDRVVLAADTVVVLGGDVLGKPADVEDAVAMLLRLSGRTHRVLTGWAVVGPETAESGVAETRVRFRRFDEEEARAYAATGEPLDKAGAYGYQGAGRRLVDDVDGPRSNVIGLPLAAVVPALERAGVRPSTAQRGDDDPG